MKPPCVILAGGRSSRMGGGDKCLLPLAGKPLLAHVLARVAPQCGDILLNSNSDPRQFQIFSLPVAQDTLQGFQGPLAGLLTGLRWARARGAEHLLTVPCDTPFLPHHLVTKLATARTYSGAQIAVAADDTRSHPVIGLWPVALAERLEADLLGGVRAIHRWLGNFSVCEIHFADSHFQNINTPEDLQAADITKEVSATSGIFRPS
jgi:molybdopterin-guanine dinucleotide biosynthesis protein A